MRKQLKAGKPFCSGCLSKESKSAVNAKPKKAPCAGKRTTKAKGTKTSTTRGTTKAKTSRGATFGQAKTTMGEMAGLYDALG